MIQLTFESHDMIAKFGDRASTQITARAVNVDVTIADLETAARILSQLAHKHDDAEARGIAERLQRALAQMTLISASHTVAGVEIESAVDPHAVIVRAFTAATAKVAERMAADAIERAAKGTP